MLLSGLRRINGEATLRTTYHPAPLIASKMIERSTIPWFIDCSDYHPKNRIRWSVVAAWIGAVVLGAAVWAAVVKVIL